MAERICPWWLGYLLASPVRRLMQDPAVIVGPYVKTGMTVLDVGSAMGFFSIPMARLVGEDGRVICVDVQERMLASLARRAVKAGVRDRLELRRASSDSLGIGDLAGTVQFALTFAVVHEVPDPRKLFSEIHASLASGARLLVSEPSGHVSPGAFEVTIATAQAAGFRVEESPSISRSYSRLLARG